jgi:hypothetical protein
MLISSELMFLETSALTGENVEEAFLKCARSILGKIETGTSVFICLYLFTNLAYSHTFLPVMLNHSIKYETVHYNYKPTPR